MLAAGVAVGQIGDRPAKFDLGGGVDYELVPLEPGSRIKSDGAVIHSRSEGMAGWKATCLTDPQVGMRWRITPKSSGVVYAAVSKSWHSRREWGGWELTTHQYTMGTPNRRFMAEYVVYRRSVHAFRQISTPKLSAGYPVILYPTE